MAVDPSTGIHTFPCRSLAGLRRNIEKLTDATGATGDGGDRHEVVLVPDPPGGYRVLLREADGRTRDHGTAWIGYVRRGDGSPTGRPSNVGYWDPTPRDA